jgi:hypothetical protein
VLRSNVNVPDPLKFPPSNVPVVTDPAIAPPAVAVPVTAGLPPLAAVEFTPATGDVRESDPDVQAAVAVIARPVRRMTICLMVQLSRD